MTERTKLFLLAFIPQLVLLVSLGTAFYMFGGMQDQAVTINPDSVQTFVMIFLVIGIINSVVAFFVLKNSGQGSEQLLSSLEQICKDWDLNASIPDLGEGDIGRIAVKIKQILNKFQDVVHRLKGSTKTLLSHSVKLASAANEEQNSQRTQQREILQVSNSTNQMTQTVQDVAENASHAAEAANSAALETERGDNLVSSTLNSINQLAQEVTNAREVIQRVDTDSKEIGTVLDVIKGIAEQTNLLALNAAIEAARAGEQGRGFAVVADEVRTLAQRTQQSTQEIENMIERLQSGAAKAVTVMEEGTARAQENVEEASKAGESLRAIKEAIISIGEMNSQIARMTDGQAQVAAEINENLSRITDVSNNSAKSSQDAVQCSSEIENLAKELDQIAKNFSN